MVGTMTLAPPPALHAAPGYAAALRLLGAEARCLDVTVDGHVIGQAQVVLRRFPLLGRVAWLPLGPVWQGAPDLATQTRALRDLAQRMPVTGARLWVSVAPDSGADVAFAAAGHQALGAGRMVARLDLTPGPDHVRRHLHGKWRNALTRGETASGLRWRQGALPQDPDHWLLRAESDQRRQRGYRGWPVALTLAYARANPGDARLFWAEDETGPLAGVLILRHGTGATYHLGWTSPAGRRAAAHQVLLWQAILWLSAQGVTQLDLGWVDADRTPGLARFKLGTGAQPVRLGRTWLHQPALARLRLTTRQVCAEPLAFCRVAV